MNIKLTLGWDGYPLGSPIEFLYVVQRSKNVSHPWEAPRHAQTRTRDIRTIQSRTSPDPPTRADPGHASSTIGECHQLRTPLTLWGLSRWYIRRRPRADAPLAPGGARLLRGPSGLRQQLDCSEAGQVNPCVSPPQRAGIALSYHHGGAAGHRASSSWRRTRHD